MSENNSNEKSPIYSSEFLMSKELVKDFCSVDFRRTKITFLVFFLIVTCYVGVNLALHIKDWIVYLSSFLVAVINCIVYFRLKNAIKISYEKALISEGKEVALKYELFEDKIVSHKDELIREYYYHQITKLFETKYFIMLHLKHNLHITIEKSSLNTDINEVKAFVINKCDNVKKKKFINCVNEEKWSKVFLIALFVVSVAGTVAYILM